ncbi:MAG: alpha/beta hydrolase-fold protein [Terracidiphilus sp.]|jgi:enterochelin esterase family protein
MRFIQRFGAIVSCLFLLSTSIAHGQGAAPAPAQAPIATPAPVIPVAARPRPREPISPEVLPDRSVIFRLLAPNATSVTLEPWDVLDAWAAAGQISKIPELVKNADGVWEATTPPIPPGAYRYLFKVDGIQFIDPDNPATSESNNMAWSLFVVPGSDFMDDRENIPHGSVSEVFYYSTALSRQRRMHIYLPPGYENGKQKYPVFYLLHGSGDTDDAWTTVGRANFILDNLIAAGKAVPMIVVMPAGHTRRHDYERQTLDGKPHRDEFGEDFINDIMPYVEKNYRVRTDRAHTAIAGLSMGGEQALNISIAHLNRFAYVGVWSAGVFGASRRKPGQQEVWPPIAVAPEWVEEHAADLDNAQLKKGLKLLWFGTGADDHLLPITEATIATLKDHGFNPVFVESKGGHHWGNWRDYLNEFAPQLFR